MTTVFAKCTIPRLLVLIFLSTQLGMGCSSLSPISAYEPSHFAELNIEARKAKTIWVSLANGEYYHARSIEVAADSTRIIGRLRAGGKRSQSFTIPTHQLVEVELRIRKRRGFLGLLIGGGLGVGATVAQYYATGCHDIDYASLGCAVGTQLSLIVFGGGGAILGTIIGVSNTYPKVYRFNDRENEIWGSGL